MRKEISHSLSYFEEGEENIIDIKIRFSSYRVMTDYSVNQEKAASVIRANNNMNMIEEKIAIERMEKADGWKDRIKDLEKDYVVFLDDILDTNNNGFFEERFRIIKRLLTDNGYKDNEMLMSSDFWEEKVDPADLAEFLELTVYKDADNKKKAVGM